jgi:hypothetical protein
MRDSQRFKLRFGPYRTPRFRYGSIKQCALQGDVKIVGISNGRIPWPLAVKPGRGGRSFVLYGDLAKAVRHEAAIAVAYWWGVRPNAVTQWRKALGVGRSTKGSRAVRTEHNREADCQDSSSPYWRSGYNLALRGRTNLALRRQANDA